MTSYQPILTAAKEIARAAGRLALTQFTHERKMTRKGFRDFVTDADFAAQQLVVERVREQFPGHGFIAEEDDDSLDDRAEYVWIIDPIDGTTNYSRKVPFFCVSLGVAHDGQMVIGVIYDPVRDELFSATRGGGAFVNGVPIHVSTVSDMNSAIVSFDWSRDVAVREATLQLLQTVALEPRSVRSFGAAAIAICWVACGRVDAYFNYQLSAWDVAAGQVILTEAGGGVSGFDGRPFNLYDPQSWAVFTNGAISIRA